MFLISLIIERVMGTARFFLDFTYKHLLVQVVFTLFGAIVVKSMFGYQTYSYGIWPAYFVYITIRCMKNPKGITEYRMRLIK